MQKRQRIKRQESENHQRISSQEHKAHRRPITTHKNIKLARSSARLPCLACTKTAKREAAIALDSSKSSPSSHNFLHIAKSGTLTVLRKYATNPTSAEPSLAENIFIANVYKY
eukprot:scaffold3169_cov277-Chaetoceros_neogracile.AAC.5